MFDLKKTATALCLSGLAVGGIAASATAAAASTSQATSTTQADLAAFCNYQVVGAPHDLWVHSGPNAAVASRVGYLRNNMRTTGDCTPVANNQGKWIHLSNRYIHTRSKPSDRGFANAGFLRKV